VNQTSFIKQICVLLQQVGEMFFVESLDEIEKSYVVVDPQWLSQKLIGYLFCPEELIEISHLEDDQKRELGKFYMNFKRNMRGKADKFSLSTNQINELSLGLNEEFGSNEGAIAQILEELKICVRIGVCEEDGGVEEKKGEIGDPIRYFPCFTDRLCCEGHEGMRSGMKVLMEGGERVVGRRYQISNQEFMFVPGFFPSLFAEVISSIKVRDVVGYEMWRDCLKVQVSGGLIVRLEIVEREHFFDLSVMKKEMKMVGEVEDEVFGLLNRVDLMIMNKFRGEMRDGVEKRCIHPESLMMSLFLEGGEILDRNQVEYDEKKEDEYLLGSGLDGFEWELERSEREELRLILRSQISFQLETIIDKEEEIINKEYEIINQNEEIIDQEEETQFIVENAQIQQNQSHQQTQQDYNSISNQVIEMMDELEGFREWMEEDQKERFQDINKMIMRASNVEEMRDCLKLVEGLFEEIPHLIDEERVLELRREIEKLISALHPHLMSLDPSIMLRVAQMRIESGERREIHQLEKMVEELEGYWKNMRNEKEDHSEPYDYPQLEEHEELKEN